MSWRKCLVTCVIAVLSCGPAFAEDALLIGIVEAQPDANASSTADSVDHLRLAFQYKDGMWTSICKGKGSSERNAGCALKGASDLRDWEVVFNGQDLGKIQTQGWRNSEYYSFVGALKIKTSPVPTVKDTLERFSAWFGEPTRRPLLALSNRLANSPGRVWQREAPESSDAAIAWPIFEARIPSLPSCKSDSEGRALKERPTVASDMVVSDKIRFAGGSHLLGIRVKNPEDCEHSVASDLWLMRPAEGAAFALEGFATVARPYRMNLVDIESLVGNGSPQAIFFYSGYNEDGYVLYYDHYRKSIRFTWGYH